MSTAGETWRLLEALDGVTAELARALLAERGVPSVLHGPDFDLAELGRAAHTAVRGTDLFVPLAARERAEAILREAWGDEVWERYAAR